MTTATGALAAATLTLTGSAPAAASRPLSWIELQIRKDEALHNRLHLAAAHLLSLCPCTRRQATQQYERAHPHAPGVWQATALRTCQEVVAARLRPEADVAPPADTVLPGDVPTVSSGGNGTVSVSDRVTIAGPSGAERRLSYYCEVRRGAAGEWQLQTLRLLE